MKNKFDIKELSVVPPPYGGVSVYVSRLIDRLKDDGITAGGYYSADSDDDSIKESKLFHKWTWMQTSLFPFKIWKYLCETKPYRIVHSHFGLEGMAYLWFIKKLGHKKVVVTVHNTMIPSYYQHTNFINRHFLDKMLKSSDVCWITVSEEGKQQLLSLPVKPRTSVYVIPAYIPIVTDEYEPLSNSMREYLDSHKQSIAFYGHSFMEYDGEDVYGFKTAIECYSILKKEFDGLGLVLCIADSSDKDKINNLFKFAGQLDVEDEIYWQQGAIDNIRTLWRSADVYLRPTSTDGDSVSVREALDEGSCVVASDVCVRPNGVLKYHYNDIADLCMVMRQALSIGRHSTNPKDEYYHQMKDLYSDLL